MDNFYFLQLHPEKLRKKKGVYYGGPVSECIAEPRKEEKAGFFPDSALIGLHNTKRENSEGAGEILPKSEKITKIKSNSALA